MSEYQYVTFRAIDGPVSDENLEFMQKQSSRAEITPWSFDNEYHYGGFHGDAEEMLRRGYDFHLHYANFGVRKLMIRLPNGLPDAKAAEPYFEEDSLFFLKDKSGRGGTLSIEPFYEAGELEELWDTEPLLERLLPLRAEILDGDLRPLYLAHLAVVSDDNHDPEEEKDAPVPAGLEKLTLAQRALAEFYGIGEALIAAAAQDSSSLPERKDAKSGHEEWLQRQPASKKDAWLAELMADAHSAARREMLADFQKSQDAPSWPSVRIDRTVAELKAAAEKIQSERNRQRAEEADRKRAKKLAEMAADPTQTLRKTEQLVKKRSVEAYREVAELLTDLRNALSGSKQSSLADRHARKLKENNPNLTRLTSELRRQGFLKK